MKTLVSFANVVKTVAACVVMGLSFVACQKDDLADHSNKEEGKAKLVIDEKPNPTPVYRDSSWVKVSNDTITIVVEHFKNDTLINADSVKCNFGASIKRTEDKLQTTEARLANLDFSFGESATTRNGKMQFVGKQQITDADGQTYNGEALSGYCTFGSLKDVHAELVSFKKTNLQNEALEPGADEAKLVNTKIQWNYVVSIVNAPNLEGKTFELTTNNTEHLRFIPKNAPELISTDTTMVRRPDVWFTNWDLIIKESWSNDSIAEKKKTVRTNASVEAITLEDKFVSSFDYSYTNDNLAWGAWKAIQSNDSSVSLEEQEGSKLGNASNGYSDDAFDTKYVAKRQRATVLFGGFKWNIPAEEVTLTTSRNVFVEQTSDLDGYSMVKFVNDEIARYNNANDKTLTESCKLYLKLQTPDLDKIEFAGTKVHTNGMAKIDGSVIPVFTDGTKGAAISFKWSKAESWYWKNDSVIAEGVTFVNQTTGELKLKGDVKESKKTFATDNDEVTIACTQFDADFELPVTVDGVKKMTTWHATWFENFYVVYQGKKVALTKSSYNVKNQNDALKKDEARSNATSEVWGYSVEGLFNIDEDSRSAYGYGRLTKTIGENYWDESTKGEEHTSLYSKRWCDFIRYKSDGTKTKQTYTHIFNNLTGGSEWNVSAEQAVETSGNVIPLAPSSENRTDDFCKFIAKKYGYEATQDYVGAVQQKDFASFIVSEDCVFEVEGKKLYFNNPEHSINSNVNTLVKESEDDTKEVYKHQRDWTFTFGGAQLNATSLGHVTIAKSDITPDFDIEVGKIFASVSRPSNRNASDITAYTYLLVSKDGKKCLPIGIYHDVVTAGEITDMQAGFNSACYVKDENKVVATRAYSDSGLGMMIWCGADGNPVDAASHLVLQGAGFNDRGNDWVNHTGKYAPRATKKGNVTVVTFEGTNVSYTFKGWNVQ